jgi:hypothetical protein
LCIAEIGCSEVAIKYFSSSSLDEGVADAPFVFPAADFSAGVAVVLVLFVVVEVLQEAWSAWRVCEITYEF